MSKMTMTGATPGTGAVLCYSSEGQLALKQRVDGMQAGHGGMKGKLDWVLQLLVQNLQSNNNRQ